MADFVATERSSYKKWSKEILRYSDLDPVGHVNNNAYGQLVENARTLLFDDAQKISGLNNKELQTKDWVIRRLEFDFLKELRYPGEVDVGIAVTRFGNSSMIVHHGVFSKDYCAATAMGVSVYFDLSKRASTTIPRAIKEAMKNLAGSALL
jgi:acyl-CoA thioester hydrolase|tara:strand:- start:193 stop:645 length:453 start_codon:yes stop_codon:yes gene_type:complete